MRRARALKPRLRVDDRVVSSGLETKPTSYWRRPRTLKLQPASLSSSCGAPFHDGVTLAWAAWICAIDSCSASTCACSSSILAWASSSSWASAMAASAVASDVSGWASGSCAQRGGAHENGAAGEQRANDDGYASFYSLSPQPHRLRRG